MKLNAFLLLWYPADVTISAIGVPRASNTQELHVRYGDEIQLKCTSTGPSSLAKIEDGLITWYRNGIPIDPLAARPGHGRLAVRNAKQISRLTIRDASELDSGQYMCVRGQGETRKDNDRLNVLVVNGLEISSQLRSEYMPAVYRYIVTRNPDTFVHS